MRRRALQLADDDAAATRLPREPDAEGRRAAVRAALDTAADVPHALTEIAVDVAGIGELLAGAGNPRLVTDALTATHLTGAAAVSAASLVAGNLRSRPDDPCTRESAERAAAATAAAARVAHHDLSPIRNVHP